MRTYRKSSIYFWSLALTGLLMTPPVMADKPSWAGGGNEGKHGSKNSDRDDNRHEKSSRNQHDSGSYSFDDQRRRIVNDYYGTEFRSGKCPPGLAKKNNGCQPPGQAKKWNKGRALPGDLRYYDLPRDLMLRLSPPPSGHRYVRVASDILLITIGTSMVIDAIEDIGRQ
jgi:Ni/Co efflux regulator RcnB